MMVLAQNLFKRKRNYLTTLFYDPSYFDQNKLQIIEGDRFAVLFAMFIKQELKKKLNLKLSRGIIQTAYAKFGIKYITETLGIYTKYAPTEVKYLHRVAHEFDIGIYFEANENGAVIYKEQVLSQLKEFELFELELFQDSQIKQQEMPLLIYQ